jgi:predicted enzyme related to lactoylglutathione lyase
LNSDYSVSFIIFADTFTFKIIYMKVRWTSVLVDDQKKALKFYTELLGFIKKTDVPMGEHSWLTVVSKEEPDGVEVVLEPMGFAPAKVYQKALKDGGIPLTMFHVDNVQSEFERLEKLGVKFSMKPTQMGPTTLAVFDDTCGNNIQLIQV